MLHATLAEGVSRGEIDATLPAPLVILCTLTMGGIPQLVRRASDGAAPVPGWPPAEKLADVSVEMLFRAIAPPGAAPKRAASRRKKNAS